MYYFDLIMMSLLNLLFDSCVFQQNKAFKFQDYLGILPKCRLSFLAIRRLNRHLYAVNILWILLLSLHLSIRERESGFIDMPVGQANDETPSRWKVVNI